MSKQASKPPETLGHRPVSNINLDISLKLIDYADTLIQQGAEGFRSKAYRRAAETVAALDESIDELLAREGRKGLIALPGIGRSIAAVIAEIVVTGRWIQLDRLHGELSPADLFQTIPGIGPELSAKFVEEGQLETLEDLECAVHNSDTHIEGLGPRRKEAIAAILAKRLGRPLAVHPPMDSSSEAVAPVDLLLQVDAMYRERAANGTLRKIAPKRLNPTGEAWLPIMHASHDQWHFTALYSNTVNAHKFSKTTDWVVIYYQSDGYPEGRCTVVTETQGPHKGERAVRGRESERGTTVSSIH